MVADGITATHRVRDLVLPHRVERDVGARGVLLRERSSLHTVVDHKEVWVLLSPFREPFVLVITAEHLRQDNAIVVHGSAFCRLKELEAFLDEHVELSFWCLFHHLDKRVVVQG